MTQEKPGTAPLPIDELAGERRGKQRFVARRRGAPCFWLVLDGRRIALNDLSAEGFSYSSPTPRENVETFDFVLQREGLPDEIRGRAETVNHLADGAQTGCHFLSIEGDGQQRLRDWLIAHVIVSASVRITEKDAAAIVAGPSLI